MRPCNLLLVAYVVAGVGGDDAGGYVACRHPSELIPHVTYNTSEPCRVVGARRTSWEWREKRKRSCEATRRSKAGSAKNARAVELAFGVSRDEGNASDADRRERCPPRHPDLVHFDACTATPVNAAYIVNSLDDEATSQPGDCLVVSTASGNSQVCQVVEHMMPLIDSYLPSTRSHCQRLRWALFCKGGLFSPYCNVTFAHNVGKESLALLVALANPVLRRMARDGLLSVPSTINPKKGVRRRKIGQIMAEFSKENLPSSYLSFALGPGDFKKQPGELATVAEWKGVTEPAYPRPLMDWAIANLPWEVVQRAVDDEWHIEYSNGIFFADREAVSQYPPVAYSKLIPELALTNPESGHFMERVWKYIFNVTKPRAQRTRKSKDIENFT